MLGAMSTAAFFQGTFASQAKVSSRVAALPAVRRRAQRRRQDLVLTRIQAHAQEASGGRPPTPAGEEGAGAPQVSSVTFAVTHHVKFGQKVKVVGSPPALGAWDCSAAPAMEWAEGDHWSLTVDLPAGQHEFKLVVAKKDDSLNWEGGDNRLVEVPDPLAAAISGNALQLVCEWSHTDAMLATPPGGQFVRAGGDEGGEGAQVSPQAREQFEREGEGVLKREDLSGEPIGAIKDQEEPMVVGKEPGREARPSGEEAARGGGEEMEAAVTGGAEGASARPGEPPERATQKAATTAGQAVAAQAQAQARPQAGAQQAQAQQPKAQPQAGAEQGAGKVTVGKMESEEGTEAGKKPTAPEPVVPSDRPAQSPATPGSITESGGAPAGGLKPSTEKAVKEEMQAKATDKSRAEQEKARQEKAPRDKDQSQQAPAGKGEGARSASERGKGSDGGQGGSQQGGSKERKKDDLTKGFWT